MEITHPYILRVICKDTKGIINWVTGLITSHRGNILKLQQLAEEDSGLFAMRLEVENLECVDTFKSEISDNPFEDFQYWISRRDLRQKVALMVTKEESCLYELLIKQKTGELFCEIPLIISNRETLAGIANSFAIPFYHLPIEKSKKLQQEEKILELLDEYNIDLIVLARYMQILSPSFVHQRLGKIINIHHSFLPAFKGARPYHQAWERGVKMIGATSHYVTEDLDEGPIIHQAATKISHLHAIKSIIRAGSNLEREVLAKAVRSHLESRIILTGKRTIVFPPL